MNVRSIVLDLIGSQSMSHLILGLVTVTRPGNESVAGVMKAKKRIVEYKLLQ